MTEYKGTPMGNVINAHDIRSYSTQVEHLTKQSKAKRYPYNLGSKTQDETNHS